MLSTTMNSPVGELVWFVDRAAMGEG